jgi:hypothetical protein
LKVNKDWHKKNKMPKNPTMDQRIDWHLDHQKKCSCRAIPDKLLEEIKRRKIRN